MALNLPNVKEKPGKLGHKQTPYDTHKGPFKHTQVPYHLHIG